MGTFGRRHSSALLRGATFVAFVAPSLAAAQTPPEPKSAPRDVVRRYDIPAQKLSRALLEFSRQSNVLILFSPDTVRGKRSVALHARANTTEGLAMLLKGSGLQAVAVGNGYKVTADAEKSGRLDAAVSGETQTIYDGQDIDKDVPQILVTGRRQSPTLNLDIQRSEDDPQPYVVYNEEQIKRSGATNLDDFFRDTLGANATASTGSQQINSNGLSQINLRGLGINATLILVDGRRLSQPNTGSGQLSQSSLNGIPLEQIERIEVLASSASGIYGADAVGGVINIITKRDYKGITGTAYYADNFRGGGRDVRLSLGGTLSLEGGRTRITASGSWQKVHSFDTGERDFTARARALAIANDPNLVRNFLLLGTTPNIRSTNGTNLTLKAAYGGTALGSPVTYVPFGYRGVALDGVAPLVANAGRQNLELPDTSQQQPFGNGGRYPLSTGSQRYAADIDVRREFTNWLSLYAAYGYSRSESPLLRSRTLTSYSLTAAAPNNPFNQAINVLLPAYGKDVYTTGATIGHRGVAGAIVKLPYSWSAVADVNLNWTRYTGYSRPDAYDRATTIGLENGTIDVLRDVSQYPITYGVYQGIELPEYHPRGSDQQSYTLKLAGPLGFFRVFGNKPVVTAQYQRERQHFDDAVNYASAYNSGNISYTPERSQTVDSLYGEFRFPIIAPSNKIPFLYELELQAAYRQDWYSEIGADASISCLNRTSGPLVTADLSITCPPSAVNFATSKNKSGNPTLALKWAPSRDVAIRGSYSTGYQPPYLNALVQNLGPLAGATVQTLAPPGVVFDPSLGYSIVSGFDPLRGNEQLGTALNGGLLRVLPTTIGGNTEVLPQTSRSWSIGGILTPRFVPGLRVSVDWTRIELSNVYFSPIRLLGAAIVDSQIQRDFADFLRAYPERFPRAAPVAGDPYQVGRIISADISTANFSRQLSEALDIGVSYDRPVAGGNLNLLARATISLSQTSKLTPSSPEQDVTDVITDNFSVGISADGGNDFKANGTLTYSTDRWSIGGRLTYFSGYWLQIDHSVVLQQGAARIRDQYYFDVFGSVKLFGNTDLRAGINNVLDRDPPIVARDFSGYSRQGKPWGTNFFLSISHRY